MDQRTNDYDVRRYKVALAIDAALTKLGKGSAEDLAALLELGHSTVSSWRSGRRLPRTDKWREIETFLLMPSGTIAAILTED